jgi:hypothetical protein
VDLKLTRLARELDILNLKDELAALTAEVRLQTDAKIEAIHQCGEQARKTKAAEASLEAIKKRLTEEGLMSQLKDHNCETFCSVRKTCPCRDKAKAIIKHVLGGQI